MLAMACEVVVMKDNFILFSSILKFHQSDREQNIDYCFSCKQLRWVRYVELYNSFFHLCINRLILFIFVLIDCYCFFSSHSQGPLGLLVQRISVLSQLKG